MIHNAITCRQNHVTKLSARQQLHNPLFQVFELDIVPRRDDAGLVKAAIELDNYLAISVIIDLLKLANVSW